MPTFWYPHSISVEKPSLKAAVKPEPAFKPRPARGFGSYGKTADPEKPRKNLSSSSVSCALRGLDRGKTTSRVKKYRWRFNVAIFNDASFPIHP